MALQSVHELLNAFLKQSDDKLQENLTTLSTAGNWYEFAVPVPLNNNDKKSLGIFTRQCYLCLYADLLQPLGLVDTSPFYVLSGTSGIGKSTFGFYFTFRRILEVKTNAEAKENLCILKGDTYISIKIDRGEVLMEFVEMENNYFKESIASKYKWVRIDPGEAGMSQARNCQGFVQTSSIVIISSGLRYRENGEDRFNQRASRLPRRFIRIAMLWMRNI